MPRKTFNSGEILTASDVNLYLSNEAIQTDSTATAYEFTVDDRYKLYRMSNTAPSVLTVSTATAFEAGERVDVIRDGTATVTIAAGSGVTFAGEGVAGTAFLINPRYGAASIYCVAANDYRIIGSVVVG
jgi:P pilus assembly chaperone PapD